MPSSELDALEAAHAIHRRCTTAGSRPTSCTRRRPHGIRPRRRAAALPRHRRARRRRRRGRRGRRPGRRHLLLRHQRRARPRAPRRLPGRLPRPARRARRGVLPARPRRDRAARRRHRHVVERGRHRPARHRGRDDVCRRAPRRAARGHAPRRRCSADPPGISARCPTTRPSAPCSTTCFAPPAWSRPSRDCPAASRRPGAATAPARGSSCSTTPTPSRPSRATGYDLVADAPVDGSRPPRPRWRGRDQGGLTMLASQRRSVILDLVEEAGAVKVSDLVERLGVSDMTIRRDIERLSTDGLARARPRRRPRARRHPQQRGARLLGEVAAPARPEAGDRPGRRRRGSSPAAPSASRPARRPTSWRAPSRTCRS